MKVGNHHTVTRRSFLEYTALMLSAGAIQGFNDITPKVPLRLSFSTLGCPAWDLHEILTIASAQGYKGIEVRGIKGELDLSKVPEFLPGARNKTLRMLKDQHLSFVNLGSSVNLHIKEAAKRALQIDEGKRYIELAASLECPYIRVFPNELPKDQTKEETVERIVEGLQQLSDAASGSTVTILMETHGDVVDSSLLETIMKKTDRKNVGLVWDMFNMWNITNESPTSAFQKLKPYIKHTHIKDGIKNNGKVDYVFLGEGNFPIKEELKLLKDAAYEGYYSFEWEKLWHPEIADPSLAIPDYANKMKMFWKEI